VRRGAGKIIPHGWAQEDGWPDDRIPADSLGSRFVVQDFVALSQALKETGR
jgi:hypothetical protein